MKMRLYDKIIVFLFFYCMGVSASITLAEDKYYGTYGYGLFADAFIRIEKTIPQESIVGHIISLSSNYNQSLCQLALYEWGNGWRRYANPRSGSNPLQVVFQRNEGGWVADWFISLAGQPPLNLPFAVLLVESSKMDALPEFVETLAKIDHLGHAIRTTVLQGDAQQRFSGLTNQESVEQTFSVHELLISLFLRELNERRQQSSSSEHAFVLILGTVNYPDMYEVERRFDFHLVLEAAKGYKEQDSPHNRNFPSSVKIIRNITQDAQHFVIPYQAWRQRPEQYKIFLEDGDILYIPGSF